MKASISWLQDYVEITMAVPRLADALTMAGLEVEGLADRYAYLERVQVGRIRSVAPHPDAAALALCQVECGQGLLQVVCGAPNAAPGLLAPLALPGTTLPGGPRLGRSQIRGALSEGMLCSAAELGLGVEAQGLMALDAGLAVGSPLAAALGLSDPVLEIGLTPNRADCLCLLGIAREIAALQQTPLRYPDTRAGLPLEEAEPDGLSAIHRLAAVEIAAPRLCPRYAARMVAAATVGPSPFWLQDRLLSVGLRPINNIVDATNFVMLEVGQPLHAFDFDLLAGGRIVVRTAGKGERFVTLDGKERQLTPEMLLICDAEKAVAVAGVMGGLNSEITPATRRVLIEGALFNSGSIRRTARSFGLATDASHRFERGVDPLGTLGALERAAGLMIRTAGARGVAGVIDVHPGRRPIHPIRLSLSKTNALLGTGLSAGEIAGLLRSIECAVEDDAGEALSVTPPSCRVDISRPEDLMEEVARRWGYERIPTTFPRAPEALPQPSRGIAARNRVRRLLNGFGFREAIHYSFVAADSGARLRLADGDRRRCGLPILNPLSEEGAVMRTSLLPGMLQALERNLSQGARTLKLYELGRAYLERGPDTQPEEIEMLAGLWSGLRREGGWHGPAEACDFYDLKGLLEGLLSGLDLPPANFSRAAREVPYLRAGHAARFGWGERWIGAIGELHPQVLDAYGVKGSAFFFELQMAAIEARIPEGRSALPLPRFPPVARDLTLIVDRETESGSLTAALTALEQPLLESVQVFAVYEGSPVPPGRKSVSLRITYRSGSQTLADEQVNALHQELAGQLLERFKGTLPG
jgi:phenylalanyl-tRNA synthetase beta chain